MDPNNIKKVANSLSKLIEDNEKIVLSSFSAKLSKASSEYPEDKTIGQMADITKRMLGPNRLFITKAEIKDLYNRLYTRNNKFIEIFGSDLGYEEKNVEAKKYARASDEGFDLLKKAYDGVIDPVLGNALRGAFGDAVKPYVEEVAENAKEVCKKFAGVVKANCVVDVVNGNDQFILCRASFDTPKGKTSVFVPVELENGKTLIPSVFIGNWGPVDFNKANLEGYISKNAGQKLELNDKIAFDAVNSVKGKVSEVSEVDLALVKLNATKESKVDFYGGILYQNVEPELKNVEVNVPAYKDSEIESFAKKFNSVSGEAEFKFGNKIVNLGKNLIANKLNSLSLKNHQISVFDSKKDDIMYAVSLNGGKIAFKVPMKIKDGNISVPEVVIAGGEIESFDKEGVANIFRKEAKDYKAAAVASPVYGLKSSELIQIVRDAMQEGNYVKAEDTLNVLADNGDDKAYQTAFKIYSEGLGGKIAVAGEKSKCSMVVQSPSSKHLICGHTGLPLHKVSQDKHGNCIAEYRKGMNESYEGASFMNSKIFL